MRDRQNSPTDEAIYWVEYVVGHKGAKHLRVPYLDMPLYQIYMIDVIAVFILVTIIIQLYNFVKKSDNLNNRDDKISSKKNE